VLRAGNLGGHSGFLTMGDKNTEPDQTPTNGGSTPALSTLVEPGWVIGVARGMIPWVGALKLVMEGGSHSAAVPSGSWQFLGLTFVGVIFLAYATHYALKREGIETPLRRREEEELAAERGEEGTDGHGFFRSLRPWGSDEEETEPEPPPPRPRNPPRPPPARSNGTGPTSSGAGARTRSSFHRTPRRRRDEGRI
jgi:hypothetical protein